MTPGGLAGGTEGPLSDGAADRPTLRVSAAGTGGVRQTDGIGNATRSKDNTRRGNDICPGIDDVEEEGDKNGGRQNGENEGSGNRGGGGGGDSREDVGESSSGSGKPGSITTKIGSEAPGAKAG